MVSSSPYLLQTGINLKNSKHKLGLVKPCFKFIKKFNKLVGVENIGLMHVNDSLNDFDTRKDRHANIGEGYIGIKGLKYFYQYFAKKNIAGILETPTIGNYANEIKLLKS